MQERQNKLNSPKAIKILFFTFLLLVTAWLFNNKYIHTESTDYLTTNITPDTSLNADTDYRPDTELEEQESLEETEQSAIPEDHKDHSKQHSLTITVKKNDNLANIFKKQQLPVNTLYKLLANKTIKKHLTSIKPKQILEITYTIDNNKTKTIQQINYYPDKFHIVTIENTNNTFTVEKTKLDLEEQVEYAKLNISSSLFLDAQKQHIPTKLIYQLIDIFTWDIDFSQDLRKNDTVEFLYKTYHNNHHDKDNSKNNQQDHNPYAIGPVIAVNFNNNNKLYQALRYEDSKGNLIDYYTPEGLSLRKSFIRSPVKYTRISSKFTLGRKHPVLHRIRAHKGVDYAAPTGTPIKAAGDGKIIHYGRKGGYGKAAIIQHGKKYTTLYAHMSRYQKNIRVGSKVKQGQVIGYVGQTGLATGPHLHYEFRIHNKHVNPLTVKLPQAKAVAKSKKADFLAVKNNYFAKLDYYNKYYNNQDDDQAELLLARTATTKLNGTK